MTAVIIASQPSHGLIHVVTDAAFYSRDQRIMSFGTKAHTIPHWPAVITGVGNASAVPLLAGALSQCFGSFDAFADAKPSAISDLIKACGLQYESADVMVAGVSVTRGPEAYVFSTNYELPDWISRDEAEANPFRSKEVGALIRLPSLVMTPVPNDVVVDADYQGVDHEADPKQVIWSLRKILEMQRQMKMPDGVGAIGGFGQITTISSRGIVQRLLQSWPADGVGDLLRPERVDWPTWHRENPRPDSQPTPAVHHVEHQVARKKRERELIGYAPRMAPASKLLQQRIALMGGLASVTEQVIAKQRELQNIDIQTAGKINLSPANTQAILDLVRLQAEQSRASQAGQFGIFNAGQQAEIARLQLSNLVSSGIVTNAQDYGSAVAVITKNIRDASDAAAVARSPLEQMTRYSLDAANSTKQLDQFGVSAMSSLENGLVSFANGTKKAKDAFKDMANSIISDLLRMIIRANVTGPLSGMLSGLFGNFGGAATQGNFGGTGGILPPIHHSGYGPGDAITARRYVHPAHFNDAPRFHSGIGPGERAAIIREDESVLTPGQMKALGRKMGSDSGAPVTNVIIQNNSGAKTTETREKNSTGGMDVRVLIHSTVKDGFASGEYDKSQRSRFGNRPPKVG